ncbi:MAG: double-strand break repair protein AddB [Pseudomonadota bacterium]
MPHSGTTAATDAPLFSGAAPHVYSIPAGRPFLKDLARGLVDALGADPMDLARAEVLLPTRRAARAFAEAIREASGAEATLAPRVRALGDLDDNDLLFEAGLDGLDLPPAATAADRRLTLARLVYARDAAAAEGGASWTRALAGADALSAFFESVTTEDADLTRLAELAPDNLAEHWRDAAAFLEIAAEAWPAHLKERGLIDPAERRRLAVEAYAERLRATPPDRPVIAAGSTGSMPAVAALLAAVAQAPTGCVVLPGLDQGLDEHGWRLVDERHPQGGLKALLAQDDMCDRAAVRRWPGSPSADDLTPRRALMGAALRPADATETLRDAADALAPHAGLAVQGLRLVATEDETHEAATVAVLVREALETPGRSVLVVTPDRELARRIASTLRRWDIAIDDSAGREAHRSTAGAFLERAAAYLANPTDPVALAALCRHPLARFGLSPEDAARAASQIDRALRGPRREESADATLERAAKDEAASGVVAAMRAALAASGFETAQNAEDRVAAHLAFCEAIAAGDRDAGETRLWSAHGGGALAEALADLRNSLAGFGALSAPEYGAFFRRLLSGVSIRPRSGDHPRALILGPLEARLQSADLVILAGLVEGGWPKAAEEDPFLSRTMRAAIGLPSPERRIGLAAHDFQQLASAPETRLVWAKRAGGAPARPSRFIVRLLNILTGDALKTVAAEAVAPQPQSAWAADLDQIDRPRPAAAPQPRPPLAARPRTLSASDLKALARDPYAVYAKKILRLRKLDALDDNIDARLRGTVAHKALEIFAARLLEGEAFEPERLFDDLERAMQAEAVPETVRNRWRPRLRRSLEALARVDDGLRTGAVAALEDEGRWTATDLPGGPLTITAKADRIDRDADGRALIWDYKTGAPDTHKQMAAGLAPQLPAEALILEAGGYAAFQNVRVAGLGFIALSGKAGADFKLYVGKTLDDVMEAARRGLPEILAAFDDPQTPYLSQPRAFSQKHAGDYDQLARRAEWARAGEEEGGE